MGAAASSEAALRAAVDTAINPPAHGKRLPRDARRWKISHVSLWLRQNELHALVDVFKNHCIDGQMLLEDCRDEDFDSIIPFVPLRRKFRRCLEDLAHLARVRGRGRGRGRGKSYPGPITWDSVSRFYPKTFDGVSDPY